MALVTERRGCFLNDATQTMDSDGDGVGDNADAFLGMNASRATGLLMATAWVITPMPLLQARTSGRIWMGARFPDNSGAESKIRITASNEDTEDSSIPYLGKQH